MPRNNTGPLTIFGIRLKSIIVAAIFVAVLLAVVNRDEILSLLNDNTLVEPLKPDHAKQDVQERDIVVDEEMLTRAMREVQTQKLEELETSDGSVPTDRFFYIIELVSGGDLEGVDLTVEPDRVILVSEGGTRTTIKRADVKQIHRHKLPPSKKE